MAALPTGLANLPPEVNAAWVAKLDEQRDVLRHPKSSVRDQLAARSAVIQQSLQAFASVCCAPAASPPAVPTGGKEESAEAPSPCFFLRGDAASGNDASFSALPAKGLRSDTTSLRELPDSPFVATPTAAQGVTFPHQVNGRDARIAHVLQGEAGFTAWAPPTAAASSTSPPPPSAPVDDAPSDAAAAAAAPSAPIVARSDDAFMMSCDATSCLVVGVRLHWQTPPPQATTGSSSGGAPASSDAPPPAVGPAVVAMTHLAHGGPIVRNTLATMLLEMALPALLHLQQQPADDGPADASNRQREEESSSSSSRGEGGATGSSRRVLSVEWYLVGAMVDMKYAHLTLSDTLLYIHGLASGGGGGQRRGKDGGPLLLAGHPVVYTLRPDGCCVWDWMTVYQRPEALLNPTACRVFAAALAQSTNATSGRGGKAAAAAAADAKKVPVCRAWGLIVSAKTGRCAPASYALGTRSFPGALLRTMVHPPDREHASLIAPVASVTTASASPAEASAQGVRDASAPTVASAVWEAATGVADLLASKVLAIPAAASGAVVSVTFASFLDRLRHNAAKGLHPPVLLLPSEWDASEGAYTKKLRAAPDAELLQYSTTPQCEPLDFCDVLRRSYVARAMVGAAAVFPQQRPLLLDAALGWTVPQQ